MTERKENKMGVMPVNRLLLSMSIPMMISMLVQALYNVVDSVFVAQISQEALNAVSLAFPAQNLMTAVAVGAGVGVNANLSKSLGEHDTKAVNLVATHGLLLSFLHYLVFLVAGATLSGVFFHFQTENQLILDHGIHYLRVCTMASVGIFLEIMLERLLQATGRTVYTMITQLVGAVINIILDPILIFGLFGFPRLEVTGAAVATVTGQIAAMLLALVFNLRFNHEVELSARGFRIDRNTIRRIYSVGIPTMVMNAIGSVMVFGFNQILLAFTEAATAVFGVYFKLQSFIFMPVFGLNNGLVPILSYNYGAKKPERIVKTIKLGVLYAVLIMLVGFSVFQLAPATLLSLFKAGEEMLEIGVPALRTISFSFLLAGYCIVCSSVFQAFGRGLWSLMASLTRQLIVLLPVAFLLAQTGNLSLVWFSFPIAEVVSVVVFSFFLHKLYLKEIKPLA